MLIYGTPKDDNTQENATQYIEERDDYYEEKTNLKLEKMRFDRNIIFKNI